jgi:mono/diheme cytochrome c family protein
MTARSPRWPEWLLRAAALTWLVTVTIAPLRAQTRAPGDPAAGSAVDAQASGEDIYRAACATCHGPDGAGSPRTVVGFDIPLPDFTDCAFATAEADVDWHAVVHEGGRIRGLDRHMPSFGDALTADQIERVVRYVRQFCAEPAWPKGDLNFPRAFFTEKAFPENEVVYTSSVARGASAAVGNEIVYERRFGARNQIEAVVPIDAAKSASGWQSGLGDVALAFRRTFLSNNRTGTIAAAGAEVAFPTGNSDRGLGNGYHVFEPFAMIGQTLPRGAFLQVHGGVELPSDPDRAPKEAYLRSALGVTYLADRGFGRSWSPQVELLFARPAGGEAEWDAVPQLQVSLSKIQHVVMAVGVRVPLNGREDRGTAVVSYLLWDWFDGPFTKFWK